MIVNIKGITKWNYETYKSLKALPIRGSVSSATKELNYVQSNVTTRIKQLENELKPHSFTAINEE